MTHFLTTDDNPEGYKLEDILFLIRQDVVNRAQKIAGDRKTEAQEVLRNNISILGLLSECIEIANSSTALLNRNFGPSDPVEPRIGVK